MSPGRNRQPGAGRTLVFPLESGLPALSVLPGLEPRPVPDALPGVQSVPRRAGGAAQDTAARCRVG